MSARARSLKWPFLRFLALTLLLGLIHPLSASASEPVAGGEIQVDGKTLGALRYFVVEREAWFPVVELGRALGVPVTVDPQGKVTARGVTLSTAVRTIEGKPFVSRQAIKQALGVRIYVDEQSRRAAITSDAALAQAARQGTNSSSQGGKPRPGQGPPPLPNQGPPPLPNQGPPPLSNQGPPPLSNQGQPPQSNPGSANPRGGSQTPQDLGYGRAGYPGQGGYPNQGYPNQGYPGVGSGSAGGPPGGSPGGSPGGVSPGGMPGGSPGGAQGTPAGQPGTSPARSPGGRATSGPPVLQVYDVHVERDTGHNNMLRVRARVRNAGSRPLQGVTLTFLLWDDGMPTTTCSWTGQVIAGGRTYSTYPVILGNFQPGESKQYETQTTVASPRTIDTAQAAITLEVGNGMGSFPYRKLRYGFQGQGTR